MRITIDRRQQVLYTTSNIRDIISKVTKLVVQLSELRYLIYYRVKSAKLRAILAIGGTKTYSHSFHVALRTLTSDEIPNCYCKRSTYFHHLLHGHGAPIPLSRY